MAARHSRLIGSAGTPRPVGTVPCRIAPPAGWAALLLLGLALTLTACGDPQRRDPTGSVAQVSDPVPSGPHLYCLTNVGHTLVAYDLTAQVLLPGTARRLALDPVGPWFAAGAGYYLARVDGSGFGDNALVRFDPRSTLETARLEFPALSNPNGLLVLPGTSPALAWVALRGSTFDGFGTNGISVVNLETPADTAFCDLNANTGTCDWSGARTRTDLTSLLGFLWDPACPANGGTGCAYAVVNNFNGAVRDGVLLVLEPGAGGVPLLLDTIPLGRNPHSPPVLDGAGRLWVVNNGGYVHYGAEGQPGTVQVLDTATFADGTPGNETLATLTVAPAGTVCADLPRPDPGCDPTGIYTDGGGTGWITTYPDDVVRTVDLTAPTPAVDPLDPALPRITGPFVPTVTPAPVLYALRGGYGLAHLAAVDPAGPAVLSDVSLQAGLGPATCAPYTVP